MKHLVTIFLSVWVCAMSFLGEKAYQRHKVNHVINNVYKLVSPKGSCSAVGVISPSGIAYVLTAGHCKGLIESGKVEAIDEKNNEYFLPLVAEDENADLLLFEAPGTDGVKLARSVGRHQHVWTMTHGNGFPSYKTEGEIVKIEMVTFYESKIEGLSGLSACSGAKHSLKMDGLDMMCAVSTFDYISTAWIVPGSSGGALLNDSGELVGIASATGGDNFGAFVTLNDIKAFMAGK